MKASRVPLTTKATYALVISFIITTVTTLTSIKSILTSILVFCRDATAAR